MIILKINKYYLSKKYFEKQFLSKSQKIIINYQIINFSNLNLKVNIQKNSIVGV